MKLIILISMIAKARVDFMNIIMKAINNTVKLMAESVELQEDSEQND